MAHQSELIESDILAYLNSDDTYCPGALLAVAETFLESRGKRTRGKGGSKARNLCMILEKPRFPKAREAGGTGKRRESRRKVEGKAA